MYVEQLDGFLVEGTEDKVYRLKKDWPEHGMHASTGIFMTMAYQMPI